MRPRAGWMVMGKRGRPSALDVCRVLAVFLSLFPAGKFQLTFKKWCVLHDIKRSNHSITHFNVYITLTFNFASPWAAKLSYLVSVDILL